MNATAIIPSIDHKQAFLAMLDDFDRNGPHNTEYYAPAKVNFSIYVQGLLDEEAGINLPDGYVPCSHRWLLSATSEIVGVTRLRHNIDTSFLLENGGHIGYDVAPSHRRKGYGHLALSVAIKEARRIGLARVLLYTGEANLASRAVIEKAGGHLEQIRYSEFWQESICKYWISVLERVPPLR
jgi:predicted acetyltransferase